MTLSMQHNLTLSTVNGVLADIFGYGSVIATGFIRKVEADPSKRTPTLSIDGNGVLRYNPGFFAEHINTENKLKEAIFHELLHPVLGDMHRRFSYIANLSSDMIINVLVAKTLGHCDLMQELYPDQLPDKEDSVGGLLRPGTNVLGDGAKFEGIYNKLWDWWDSSTPSSVYDPSLGGMRMQKHEFESIEEMREIMDILLSHHRGKVVILIGSHGHGVNDMGGQGDPMDSCLPIDGVGGTSEVDGDIKDILADAVGDVLSKQAGHGDSLVDMAVKTIKANVTLVKELLRDFTSSAEFNSFTRYMKTTRMRRQVFPRKITRVDAVMLGAGITPVFWKTDRTELNAKKDGINVFLDVSGSQYAELPMILGFLRSVKNFTDGIYQFSNKVAKTSLKELFTTEGAAKIDTTGGTDYDCIVEYCCEHDLKKVVVITDGYAGLSEENQRKALVQIEKACVIYSEHHTTNEFWRQNYHKDYDIKELFRAC